VSVRLILDTSALRAYIADDTRALNIAELIRNVEENGDTCGIPALSLLAALKGSSSADRTRLLKFAMDDDRPTAVLPVMDRDVVAIAGLDHHMAERHAHAVTERAKHDALLGTYERSAYSRFVDEEDILDL
jgi:hypothetical protein